MPSPHQGRGRQIQELAEQVQQRRFDGGDHMHARPQVKGLQAPDIVLDVGIQPGPDFVQRALVIRDRSTKNQILHVFQGFGDLLSAGHFAHAQIALGIGQHHHVPGEIGSVGAGEVQFHAVVARHGIHIHLHNLRDHLDYLRYLLIISFFQAHTDLDCPHQPVRCRFIQRRRVAHRLFQTHGPGYRCLDGFAYLGFGEAMSIFIFHGFIKGVPLELEEAADIDGCTRAGTFFRIVLPLLQPVFVTVLVLNGLWIWNDYLLLLLLLGSNGDVRTIPLAVQGFIGSFVKQWNLIMVSTLLAMLPIIVLYIFAQKYIVQGMVEGAVK